MKYLVGAVYLLLVLCMGVATWVEHLHGTSFVSREIYGSWWFVSLWILLLVGGSFFLLQQKLYKRRASFLFHVSFILILLGAGCTHFTGQQGMLHLRTSEENPDFVSSFSSPDDEHSFPLPFGVKLEHFEVLYFPGTDTPMDYVSRVVVENEGTEVRAQIAMNKIFSLRGYRFYQTSFDDDQKGAWLSVNYDPWGIPITYAGYLMLALSSLWLLLQPKGHFRQLLKRTRLHRASLLLALLCLAPKLNAKEITRQDAAVYQAKQVVYNGRIVPLNTVAKDFVRKLTGKSTYQKYSEEQVLIGCLLYPEEWQYEPLIKVGNTELEQLLGVGEYARMVDFYDEHNRYKLQEYWMHLRVGAQVTPLQKAIREVDERVALFLMLHNHTLFQPLPKDVAPLPEARIRAELFYNKVPFSTLLYRFCLVLGLIVLIGQGWHLAEQRRGWLLAFLLVAFVTQSVSLALRAYIAGRLPMGNGYETMQFMAWAILLIALCLHRKFPFVAGSFGFLMSGFALLVASIAGMNPEITPLVPVLSSPLLSLHVSLIMMAYALLAFLCINGVITLVYYAKGEQQQGERLTTLSELMLYPATLFLGIGIFIGAVWANVSWGRYWGWDPKEVWALITFMVYGIAFHRKSFACFKHPLVLHLFFIFAFLLVLMTYFGVNYLLGGMHSYANS